MGLAQGPDRGLLGSRNVAGVTLTWIRCPVERSADLKDRLPPGTELRPVGLETLFLAMTEHPLHPEEISDLEATRCP